MRLPTFETILSPLPMSVKNLFNAVLPPIIWPVEHTNVMKFPEDIKKSSLLEVHPACNKTLTGRVRLFLGALENKYPTAPLPEASGSSEYTSDLEFLRVPCPIPDPASGSHNVAVEQLGPTRLVHDFEHRSLRAIAYLLHNAIATLHPHLQTNATAHYDDPERCFGFRRVDIDKPGKRVRKHHGKPNEHRDLSAWTFHDRVLVVFCPPWWLTHKGFLDLTKQRPVSYKPHLRNFRMSRKDVDAGPWYREAIDLHFHRIVNYCQATGIRDVILTTQNNWSFCGFNGEPDQFYSIRMTPPMSWLSCPGINTYHDTLNLTDLNRETFNNEGGGMTWDVSVLASAVLTIYAAIILELEKNPIKADTPIRMEEEDEDEVEGILNAPLVAPPPQPPIYHSKPAASQLQTAQPITSSRKRLREEPEEPANPSKRRRNTPAPPKRTERGRPAPKRTAPTVAAPPAPQRPNKMAMDFIAPPTPRQKRARDTSDDDHAPIVKEPANKKPRTEEPLPRLPTTNYKAAGGSNKPSASVSFTAAERPSPSEDDIARPPSLPSPPPPPPPPPAAPDLSTRLKRTRRAATPAPIEPLPTKRKRTAVEKFVPECGPPQRKKLKGGVVDNSPGLANQKESQQLLSRKTKPLARTVKTRKTKVGTGVIPPPPPPPKTQEDVGPSSRTRSKTKNLNH